jgi:hypothetical protein
VRNSVSHIKGKTKAEGVPEQGDVQVMGRIFVPKGKQQVTGEN